MGIKLSDLAVVPEPDGTARAAYLDAFPDARDVFVVVRLNDPTTPISEIVVQADGTYLVDPDELWVLECQTLTDAFEAIDGNEREV